MGKLRILGSGTSTGVPEIGCTCPVCTSTDPRDNRLRASSLLHTDDAVILIDCGPDFREQMLRASSFEKIDGVLVTHEHYDHVWMICARSVVLPISLSIPMPTLLPIYGQGCLTALSIKYIREFRVSICRKWRRGRRSTSTGRRCCLYG